MSHHGDKNRGVESMEKSGPALRSFYLFRLRINRIICFSSDLLSAFMSSKRRLWWRRLTCAGFGLPHLIRAELQVLGLLGQHGSRADLDRAEVHPGLFDADVDTGAPVRPLHQVTLTWNTNASSVQKPRTLCSLIVKNHQFLNYMSKFYPYFPESVLNIDKTVNSKRTWINTNKVISLQLFYMGSSDYIKKKQKKCFWTRFFLFISFSLRYLLFLCNCFHISPTNETFL